MNRIGIISLGLCLNLLVAVPLVQAQSRTALPAATTVSVVGERSEGTLIRFNPDNEQYEPTQEADDAAVYGVVAALPPVVFVTSTTSVPVVTSGNALVRVQADEDDMQVGDVLTSASGVGVAKVASTSDRYAFGFVREVVTQNDDGTLSVTVDLDPEGARQTLADARVAASEDAYDDGVWSVSYVRALIAGLVVIGGLAGLVYGVRLTLGNAITAVGRNPRARTTVFSLASITILAAFALGVLTILVGVGILVVPL